VLVVVLVVVAVVWVRVAEMAAILLSQLSVRAFSRPVRRCRPP